MGWVGTHRTWPALLTSWPIQPTCEQYLCSQPLPGDLLDQPAQLHQELPGAPAAGCQ